VGGEVKHEMLKNAFSNTKRLWSRDLAVAVILLEWKRFDEALAEIDLERKLVPEGAGLQGKD